MCVGIPAKILKISEDGALADVEIGGIVRKAGLHLIGGAEVGKYVILHAGFAIQILDENEAQKTFDYLEIAHEIS